MNKNGNGIEIYSIDENKQEMIIHLGKIRDFYKEYSQLKNENQELRIQVSSREKVASKYKETIDKSIEHVEDFLRFNCGMNCADMNSLLNILKGVE